MGNLHKRSKFLRFPFELALETRGYDYPTYGPQKDIATSEIAAKKFFLEIWLLLCYGRIGGTKGAGCPKSAPGTPNELRRHPTGT